MEKTVALASGILAGIGGEKNIRRLENCMTRVRVEVQDDDKLDPATLVHIASKIPRSVDPPIGMHHLAADHHHPYIPIRRQVFLEIAHMVVS